jgi:hypothetical protein
LKVKDLLLVCGNTARGKEAFNEVIRLALRTRIKLNSIAQEAIGADSSILASLKDQENVVWGEFNSLRTNILQEVSNTAVEVGNQVSIDELCNAAGH